MKLEKYEKEILGLKDRIALLEELIEKEKEIKNDGYPEVGETYYFVGFGKFSEIAKVCESEWDNDEADVFYWNFGYGSTDKAKVEWTIKHIELVNEIKKYTRPFKYGDYNWNIYKDSKADDQIGAIVNMWYQNNSEYDYFVCEEDVDVVFERIGKEYISKFLFKPLDGDYKAVMDWLAEQEETQ